MAIVVWNKPKGTASQKLKDGLSKQYGGVHPEGWVNCLPSSWVAYVQLSRLSPPAALFLIFFPHFFGVIHAANTLSAPSTEVVHACLLLFGGSFFCSNASHAWNDLVDAPIDKVIARTKTRPIPRGAITPIAAFIFAISQAVGAVCFLFFLPADTAKAAIPTIVGTIYYPYAKRHTNLPQLVLGFCLSWGIMVGSSAMGVVKPWTDPSTICLLTASILWVVLYDTIYAHQDLADDVKIGIKSMAVLFRNQARALLWTLFLGMIVSLLASGYYGQLGISYYAVTVVGCVLSVGTMIVKVNLKSPTSCWLWFSKGFWLTGLAISGGLLADYCGRGRK
ncbi:UbiA prenyltransferase family [Pyrenophora teres f. maculata]|nr:UbiA prenyltransferase family [Pyrenophora teres f. maculata]